MIVEELKINTAETTKTVKDLRAQLKGLKDDLLNCEQGTEEYNKTLQQAANIQKELKDQMMEVNNSAQDFGQVVGNVSGVMAGFSGAVTAATGALSLFGVENEEMQKQITATMTSLIGITEGLSKIDNGVKAFKRLTVAIKASTIVTNGFAKALIATGLGAIVVLLGTIIANFDEFREGLGITTQQMEHFGDVAKGVLSAVADMAKGLAKSLGQLFKGDFKGAWNSLKEGFNVVDNFNKGVAEAERKREEERTKKLEEEAAKRAKIAQEEYKKRIEAAAKLAKYEMEMEAAKYRGTESDKYTQAAYDRQMKYFDTLFGLYKKDSDEYKAVLLEKAQYLQDWDNHFLQVQEDERNEAEKTAQKEIEEAQKASESRQKTLEQFYDELKTEQEHLDDRYNMLMDAAIKEGQDTTAIKEWYEKEKTRIVDEEEEKQTAIRKAGLKAYGSIANSIGDILNSIGDMMEEGSTEQKAIQTSAAIISTLVGIMQAIQGGNAMASQMGLAAPVGWALGAAQAAATLASGIATIVKINQVKTDGSSNSGQLSMPAINMGGVAAASPDFTQTMDGAMTTASIKDQKVYVTEHDITDTQKKVEVAQNEATY